MGITAMLGRPKRTDSKQYITGMFIPKLSLAVSKSLDRIMANGMNVQGLQNSLNVHPSLGGKESP